MGGRTWALLPVGPYNCPPIPIQTSVTHCATEWPSRALLKQRFQDIICHQPPHPPSHGRVAPPARAVRCHQEWAGWSCARWMGAAAAAGMGAAATASPTPPPLPPPRGRVNQMATMAASAAHASARTAVGGPVAGGRANT